MTRQWMIRLEKATKSFTLHTQGGVRLSVFSDVDLQVLQGESVAINGPSGVGKSTLLRMVYGNYAVQRGRVLIRYGNEIVDMTKAEPWTVLHLRRHVIGYVSQFLRVIPRVSTLDVVMEPLLSQGVPEKEALERAATLLDRLGFARKLWQLSPTTFSGGEQQRVNIARVFVCGYPILLLDEPTASLDPRNREIVLSLIHEARDKGAAILGVYHDPLVQREAADRVIPLDPMPLPQQEENKGGLNGSVHQETF